jgi:hypothetical protein
LSRGESPAPALAAEANRIRARLKALPSSELVEGERPRIMGLLDDLDSQLKTQRSGAAIETLSSIVPGVTALARAASGWDDTGKAAGKHIDDLAKEWDEVGRELKADRGRFPVAKQEGQAAFVRAMAEQSFGQVDEHYAVAVDYGRFSGVSSGAYYLGRAEGQMELALFLSRLTSLSARTTMVIPMLAEPINRVENDIVSAYARPGSTSQHTSFILANSALKLARELDQRGWRYGALATLLRGVFALTLATLPPPAADQEKVLMRRADAFEAQFAASKRDESVAEAFLEKGRIALEKSRAGGDGAERERLRAAALLEVVIPRYLEIMKGA